MSWEASESQWPESHHFPPFLRPFFPNRRFYGVTTEVMQFHVITPAYSSQDVKKNGTIFFILLSPSWSRCFSLFYWAGLDSLILFLPFFLSRYTWKVLFWNVLVNSEAYGAASVWTASQKRG